MRCVCEVRESCLGEVRESCLGVVREEVCVEEVWMDGGIG